MSSLPNDHHRAAHMVKYGLRHASKEKAADCSESPGSEDHEIDIATARHRHDLPRRISVHDQSLDWMWHLRQHLGRVREDLLRVRPLLASKRFFVGSTSVAVARYAPCPVAIFRGQPRQVRHVLVASDGSEGSRAALRFLSIFELVRDSRVLLMHVIQGFAALPDQELGEDRPQATVA